MRYTRTTTETVIQPAAAKALVVPTKPYVLVVDDSDAILSLVMQLLEMEQYAGLGFLDSTEVLPFLEQVEAGHLPALIMLDLMMPDITGDEIAMHLAKHERYKHIPVLIMTADTRIQPTQAVPSANDWIYKPFRMQELLTKITRYMPPSDHEKVNH